jgi:hypothetical protein
MCGCQMLFSVPGTEPLVSQCRQLADLMDWYVIEK